MTSHAAEPSPAEAPADHIPEPRQRLPSRARTAWRLSALMGAVPLVIAGMVVGGSIGGSWLPALLIATAVALALVSILLVPELRWRRWRYEVREQEIDIRHGAFTIRRTIVPMTRVQHVDTEQGLIQQSLDLATVSFNTAAGKNEIPHLEKREADRVRDRIAEITRDLDDV